MNNIPKISIVTVSYNAVDTIEQTISSVVNQTYENIEYIIIDGGSTDGTVDIIHKYEDRIAYWVSEPDRGIYDAMNKGIGLATGEIIGIINSDDWYEKNTVYIAAKCLQDKNIDGVCGSMRYYDELGRKLSIKDVHSNTDLKMLQKGMSIVHPSVFLRKEFYEKYGIFSLDYPIAADYELFLRAISGGAVIEYAPELYVNFRLGGASGQQSLQSVKDVRNARKQHNVPHIKRLAYYCYDIIINYYCIMKKRMNR